MIDLDEAPAIDHHERVVPVEASSVDLDDSDNVDETHGHVEEHDTLRAHLS